MNKVKQQTKQINFMLPVSGGAGKTLIARDLCDFFTLANCPLELIDADTENRTRGSLWWSFQERATKLDISTSRGLDEFIDRAMKEEGPIVLADIGAGSGQVTVDWFDKMHAECSAIGISFLAVAMVTSETKSVASLMQWAMELKNRVRYLVVKNERHGKSFKALDESKEGAAFFDRTKAPVIHLELRAHDIQDPLDHAGLSLLTAIKTDPKQLPPTLGTISAGIRMKGYHNRIQTEFQRVVDTLLPVT